MNRFIPLFFLLLFCCSNAQHQDKVDFIHAQVQIHPSTLEKSISGQVDYKFEVLANVDSIFLDAHNMEFTTVLLNGKKVKYSNNNRTIAINNKLKEGQKYRLELVYTCLPKQTVYYMGWDDYIVGNEQIWTQGQGKYTSHWLPSFDDMNEKVEFDLSVVAPENYSVIANGKLMRFSESQENSTIWHFDMQKPMSSYLLAFAMGDYEKQALTSKSGVSIENYFYPKDSLRVEPTYRHTKEIFDFFESEIGVPYPWQIYKQVPVRDFLYAGMENTSTTIFSDGYVIDSTAFVDKNYVNVNAHELAHQWFGNLVTEVDGNSHWLHEGFATYYAYLAEKEIFGDDHFYWKLYRTALPLKDLSEESSGEALTDPKASSLTFYEKGAWALVLLRETIGDTAFRTAIKSYLKKYRFANVTVKDFLNEMEKASQADLQSYRTLWLDSENFPWEEAKALLIEKSPSLKQYFKSKSMVSSSVDPTIASMDIFWKDSTTKEFKKQFISDYRNKLSNEFLKRALNEESLEIRQAIALATSKISKELRSDYENLLDDDSYVTKETVLLKLWSEFPKERHRYLEKTKDIEGLPNKNVKLLWLTLAVLTDGYDGRNTKRYFDELSGYTAPEYGFEIRQGAFQYLHQAFGFTEEGLLNLIEATTHHSWRFRQFARNLLDKLWEDETYKERIMALREKLNEEEKRYIETKLK